jgi:hypothetical protein
VNDAIIMVDELVYWGATKPGDKQAARVFGGKPSCHLTVAGDIEALHAFAAKIGLKRAWFQPTKTPLYGVDHYDLTESRRVAALKAGAVFVPGREQAKARMILRGIAALVRAGGAS